MVTMFQLSLKGHTMKTINQLAAESRDSRDPLPLPGLALVSDADRVMVEVQAWDDALVILAALKEDR
jgi:hypothetical protein